MLVGLCRLGRDASLKQTSAGKPVLQMAVAYNYGREKETQWLDISLFGPRAESVAPYMVKGTAIVAYIEDVHVRTYEKKDGTQGASLSGILSSFEFAGKSSGSSGEPAQSAPVAAKPAMQAVQDMDSDIPFSNPYRGRICYVV
jgi:single-strand DNA-binding protein